MPTQARRRRLDGQRRLPGQKSKSDYSAERRVSMEAKELTKQLLDNLLPEVEQWIRTTAEDDPAKAAELVIKVAEFNIPKVARIEFDVRMLSDKDLLAELMRREAEEKHKLLSAPASMADGDVEDAEIVQ